MSPSSTAEQVKALSKGDRGSSNITNSTSGKGTSNGSGNATYGPSSIKIITRTSVSTPSRLLRAALRPLRPRLVQPDNSYGPGSPRLTPPSRKGISTRERKIEDIWTYTVEVSGPNVSTPSSTSSTVSSSASSASQRPSSPAASSQRPSRPDPAPTAPENPVSPDTSTAPPRHRIFYFSGGGFSSPPSSQHWNLVYRLASSLPHSEVSMVSYPLAPRDPAPISLPALRQWLARVLGDARAQHARVCLAGDSSGGNIALSLGFWAAAAGRAWEGTLSALVLVSPAVDLRNCNPEMNGAGKRDPILTVGLTGLVAERWCGVGVPHAAAGRAVSVGAVSRADPTVSPLLNGEGAYRALRTMGCRVHGVIGTWDVLAPDARLLLDRLRAHGVEGEWLVWEGMMHCFPLTGCGPMGLGLREGKEAIRWMEDLLQRDAER